MGENQEKLQLKLGSCACKPQNAPLCLKSLKLQWWYSSHYTINGVSRISHTGARTQGRRPHKTWCHHLIAQWRWHPSPFIGILTGYALKERSRQSYPQRDEEGGTWAFPILHPPGTSGISFLNQPGRETLRNPLCQVWSPPPQGARSRGGR